MRVRNLVGAAVLALTVSLIALPGEAGAKEDKVRPAPSDPIAGQYVVVLRSGSLNVEASKATGKGGKVLRVYNQALKGFAVQASPSVAKKIAADANVDYVIQDGRVTTQEDVAQENVTAAATQVVPAPPSTYWGLDRIDERSLPLDGTYKYEYTGASVRAYVIDTGIQFAHPQFGGRATTGIDFVDGGAADDCNGHGTHVAGTIGGSTYGVAKSVRLVAVRVLDCTGSGTFSGVIAGVDWVTANSIKPAVANMSLGGGGFMPLDVAVQNSIESGVTYSVAAGNSNVDACGSSPARTLSAITVGATGNFANSADPRSDSRSSFSNFGQCVDIFAPGAYIKSAWLAGGVNTISGTSMAAPHVTGVAALLLQGVPGLSPSEVRNLMVYLSTKNKVVNPGTGSPNRLLYTPNPVTPA